MLRLSTVRQAYCRLSLDCQKSDSTMGMADDVYCVACGNINDDLCVLLDWLLTIDGQVLPCKCWEIPLCHWASVVWAVQQGLERYLDRSEFRDKIIQPLRKELAKFMMFYVQSEQKIETDAGVA